MADVLLMADPRVASMPVQDCRAPLVDLHTIAPLLDDRKRDPRGHFARLRRGVAGRLEEATTLLPDGLGLLIVEGYRPPLLLQRYFTGYRARLAAHPDWSDEQLDAAASRYTATPLLGHRHRRPGRLLRPHRAVGARHEPVKDRHPGRRWVREQSALRMRPAAVIASTT